MPQKKDSHNLCFCSSFLHRRNRSRTTKSLLDLCLFLVANVLQILSCAVVGSIGLVEGVVGMLLEFLSDLLDLLLATQTLLILHLFQAAFFVLGVGGLEAAFGVTVDLV